MAKRVTIKDLQATIKLKEREFSKLNKFFSDLKNANRALEDQLRFSQVQEVKLQEANQILLKVLNEKQRFITVELQRMMRLQEGADKALKDLSFRPSKYSTF